MKKILTLCFLVSFTALAYGEKSIVNDAHTANVDGLAAGPYYKETHPQEPQDIREIKVNKPLGQDKGETVRVNINTPEAQMRQEAARGFDTQSPTKYKSGAKQINSYIYRKNGQETVMDAGINVPPVSEAVDVTYEDEKYAQEKKVHLKDYKPENAKPKDTKTQLEEARERFRRSMEEQRRLREEKEREEQMRRRERDRLRKIEEEQTERIRLGEDEQVQMVVQFDEEQEQPAAPQPQPEQKKRKGAWRTPKSTGPRPAEQPKEEPTLPHTTYEEVFVGTTDPEFLHNFISQYLSPIAADDFNATIQAAVYHPEQPPQLSGFFVPENILRDAIGNYERDIRERKRQEKIRQQKEQERKQKLHNDSVWNNHAGINKMFDVDIDKNGRNRYECTRSNQLSSDYNCSRCCKLRETDYSSDSWPDGFDARKHKMLEGQLGGSDVCWCYWEAKTPDVCDPKVKVSSNSACAKCCDALLDADSTLRPPHVNRASYAEHNSRVQNNECLCNWVTAETKRAIDEEARRKEEERIRQMEEWNRQRQREAEEARLERDREWARRQQEWDRQREAEEAERKRRYEEEERQEEAERQRRQAQEEQERQARLERERQERERQEEEDRIRRQQREWEERVENARARMSAEELEEWIRRNIPW